jgi:hypothetical protein
MEAVLRLARERAWASVLPATISWSMLFGYQWAFYYAYSGHQRTVFSYYSGVLGDGLIIPAINVAGFVLMRQLPAGIPWRRLPIYALLGVATAIAVYLTQARLDLVNWSMPSPFQWSDVGQFHFVVLAAEMAYLYVVLATALNSWKDLAVDPVARRSFAAGWVGVALFATSLAADYIH